MANKVAKERLYLTADGSRVVKGDDPAAASLLVAEGGELTDAQVEQYKLDPFLADAPEPYDAVADHEARHNAADAPVETTDEDEKGLAPRLNKAKAPRSNKSLQPASNADEGAADGSEAESEGE